MKGKLGLLAAILLPLLSASAETLEYNLAPFSNTSTTQAVPRFNPDLGILTEVSISVSISASYSPTSELVYQFGQAYSEIIEQVGYDFNIYFGAAYQGGSPWDVPMYSSITTSVVAGQSVPLGAPVAMFSGTSTSNVADYIGNGTRTFSIQAISIRGATVPGVPFPSANFVSGPDFTTSTWSGSGTVTYTYTAIPEPGTIGLLALAAGMAGITASRRLRKK